MEPALKLPALLLEQPGGTFYYCTAKVANLKGRLEIRRRSEKSDAVQRDLDGPRAGDIARYLAGAGSILPTPLVISAKHVSVSEENGALHIILSPDSNGFFGELVDGQHRYAGLLRSTHFDTSDIGLCVFVALAIEDMAELFGTINSTQVRVPKSYIYDLFGYSDHNTPEKFAHTVCKITNESEHSPLHRKIKMLGKKLNAEEVLSQAAFVDALVKVISDKPSADRNAVMSNQPLPEGRPDLPLRSLYLDSNAADMAKIVSNHLTAVKGLSGDAWDSYYLKSIGIKVAMGLLKIIAPTAMSQESFTLDSLTRILQPIGDDLKGMSTRNGTNDAAKERAIEQLAAAWHNKSK